MAVIEGVSKDAPTSTNAHGGKQSHSPYRADLLPPHAMLAVAKVLAEGAKKYGDNNWHKISAAENLNHALVHLLALQAGDTSDEHLEHAAARILFALDQVRSGREAKLSAPQQAAGAPTYLYRKGESVVVYGRFGGVVAEDYSEGDLIRVQLDGDDSDGGYFPHNVARARDVKGGAA